eukprot:TRINITY_DN7333_c0_g7_i1.p1 TRINITY_DN7333_c0_g7~~TRINITY_DN7333_c0_g7_i1.p1  ORF type:complete len:503 (+),score=148.23 TRINITY_DN7333_c0_g7_i1:235-1743(+)
MDGLEDKENDLVISYDDEEDAENTTTLSSEVNEENGGEDHVRRGVKASKHRVIDDDDPFGDEENEENEANAATTAKEGEDDEFRDIFEGDDGEDIFASYTNKEYQNDEDDIFDDDNQEPAEKKLSRLVKKHKEEKKSKKNKKSKRRDSDEEGSDGEKKKKKKKRSRKSEGDVEVGEDGEKKKKKRRKSEGEINNPSNEPEEEDVNELGEEDDEGRGRSSYSKVKKNKDWFDEYLDSLKRPRAKPLEDKDILELAKATVEKMDLAAHEDMLIYNSNSNVPALNKITILKEIKTMLSKRQLWEELVHQGVLKSIKMWLDPLPDKSWPSLDIRTALFESLALLPVGEDSLRESGVGKNVMLYYKSPKETLANKKLARALIEKWSRPIFGLSSRYEDLEQADLENGEKRRTSLTSISNEASNAALEERTREVMKLKERNHANIPQRAMMDFSRRPESRPVTNAGLPSSHRSSVLAEKYIKKKMKGKATGIGQMRAVKISVEGRGRF